MTREEFIGMYGGIYEHSSWVAERCYDADDVDPSADELAEKFAACVDASPAEQRLELIRAHPDLAGKAAVAGELTDDSNLEQSSAGIDQCTADEFTEFQRLNAAYKQKFAFPFVMAVRNSNRYEILAAFAERLENNRDAEFARAITEIHKIAKLRLQALERSEKQKNEQKN